jgi:hypothetical protein
MSNSPDSTIVMLGLTGTGKTNFLVALDVVLDDQDDPEGLFHSELAADRAYLQPLKEQWLRGEELLHTSRLQTPPPHQLLVRHPASGTTAGLHLPDLAGEAFGAHFVTRSFPLDFRDRLQQAGGVLLFLHCNHSADHAILEDPGFIELAPVAPAPPAAPVPEPEWRLEDASRQVKLVDLLQFIADIGPQRKPLNIAVMFSAWELVEKAPHLGPRAATAIPNDPTRFLSINWPLLDQFLRSHPNVFRFRVFGVSARGGGTTEAEITRLTAFDRPSQRIILVDGAHRSNDITRPVRWLLGLLNSGS